MNENRRLKLTICMLTAISCLPLGSCEKKEEKSALNYEQIVSSFRGSLDRGDEKSYLACFLPQEKARFTSSEDYSKGFINDIFDEYDVMSRLSVRIKDNSELDSEELDSLEKEARSLYGTRFDFTKGQRLNIDVRVKTKKSELCDSHEITVVRYENVWYIYGEVLDSFEFKEIEK